MRTCAECPTTAVAAEINHAQGFDVDLAVGLPRRSQHMKHGCPDHRRVGHGDCMARELNQFVHERRRTKQKAAQGFAAVRSGIGIRQPDGQGITLLRLHVGESPAGPIAMVVIGQERLDGCRQSQGSGRLTRPKRGAGPGPVCTPQALAHRFRHGNRTWLQRFVERKRPMAGGPGRSTADHGQSYGRQVSGVLFPNDGYHFSRLNTIWRGQSHPATDGVAEWRASRPYGDAARKSYAPIQPIRMNRQIIFRVNWFYYLESEPLPKHYGFSPRLRRPSIMAMTGRRSATPLTT